jgi:hypothetical protein
MDEASDTPPTDGIAYDPASKLFVQRRVRLILQTQRPF